MAKKAYKTFTALKKKQIFIFREVEYRYTHQGKRGDLAKDSIVIEVDKGEELDPIEWVKKFDARPPKGWKAGEIKAADLQAFLEEKERDGSNHMIAYERRPRPLAQIKLEDDLDRVERRNRELEEAIKSSKSLDELRKLLAPKE